LSKREKRYSLKHLRLFNRIPLFHVGIVVNFSRGKNYHLMRLNAWSNVGIVKRNLKESYWQRMKLNALYLVDIARKNSRENYSNPMKKYASLHANTVKKRCLKS
jgi:hypothetical protein